MHARKHTCTYTHNATKWSLLWSREDFELVAPNVTHLNSMAFTSGLTLYRGILPVACRKFGCAFSVDKFIEKLSVALFVDVSRLLSLSRARSRAAVRSDYLSIRTTSIAADSCAMNKREEEWQAQIWSRPRQEQGERSRRISRRFLSRWRPWQRIEFDFKNLIAVCLNQTIRVKIVSFIRVDRENSIRHFETNNLYI